MDVIGLVVTAGAAADGLAEAWVTTNAAAHRLVCRNLDAVEHVKPPVELVFLLEHSRVGPMNAAMSDSDKKWLTCLGSHVCIDETTKRTKTLWL